MLTAKGSAWPETTASFNDFSEFKNLACWLQKVLLLAHLLVYIVPSLLTVLSVFHKNVRMFLASFFLLWVAYIC